MYYRKAKVKLQYGTVRYSTAQYSAVRHGRTMVGYSSTVGTVVN